MTGQSRVDVNRPSIDVPFVVLLGLDVFALVLASGFRGGIRNSGIVQIGCEGFFQAEDLPRVHSPITFQQPRHRGILLPQLGPHKRIDIIDGKIGFRAFRQILHPVGSRVVGTDAAVPDLHLLIDTRFHHALVIRLALGVAIASAPADEMMIITVGHFVEDDKRMAVAVPIIFLGAQ